MNKIEVKTELNDNKLPEGWKRVRLGEVLKYEQPYKYIVKNTQYEETGIPVLTAGKTFILGFTVEEDGIYTNLPVIIFDDFTTESKYIDFPFKVKSSAMKFLKKKDNNIVLKFVFENMQLVKFPSLGGDHKRRWISEFQYFQVPLPPLTEQRKITEILETVDETIEKTDAIIEKYKRIKQGLMQDLLTRGIDENGQIRSEKTHNFKDSPLGRIPEEWKVVELGEVAKIKRGASPRPIDNPIYFSENGRGWIRIQDVSSSYKYLTGTFQYLSKIGEQKSVSIEPGELIMSICATIGKSIILKIPACIHDGFVAFKDLSNEVDTDFLYYCLDFREKEIREMRQIGTQGNLNSKLVALFKVIEPPLPEQCCIAEVLSQIDETIEKEHKYKEKLERIKLGLMEDLLTGKVRVNLLIKEGLDR
ncbi:MAG: restriction endonuclease subunit S [Candidatus Marinimicrobia bacterium]|nr:restriction endonuclease subunit S [Candidatus Neomarinimicrobiota bacterium]